MASASDPLGSQEVTIGKDGTGPGTERDGESATDSDMDEVLRNAGLERATKKTVHRVNRDWSNKIQAAATRDVKTPAPASG